MFDKIKDALGSFRFWYCVIIAIAFALESAEIMPGAYAKAIEIFGVLGITIRTIDKF